MPTIKYADINSLNRFKTKIEEEIPTKTSDLTNDSGYTSNVGTITGIKMNGSSKGTSGVVNLGTVLTEHQDISSKENKSNKVTSISSISTDENYPSAKAVYNLFGIADKLDIISFRYNSTTQELTIDPTSSGTNISDKVNVNDLTYDDETDTLNINVY